MSGEDRPAPSVTVEGDRTVGVAATAADRARFGWTAREFAIHCHSGRVIEGRWRGVPFGPVTDAARVPPETTHFLVTARDGYRACVAVRDGRRALLGFDREAVQVSGGDATEGTPRFLARGLDSTEAVRDVDRIAAVAVPPGEDPLAYATAE